MLESAHDRFARALQSLQSGSVSTVKEAVDVAFATEASVGGEEPTEALEVDDEDSDVGAGERSEAAPGSGFFQKANAHPLVLDLLLLREYGPEWFLWELETLRWILQRDFPGGVSELNLHKLQALKTLHLTEHPWNEWEVFTWCAMPLTGILPDFETMQVPSASQIVVAIDIFNKVRLDVAWSDEVKTFLGVAWKMDGLICTFPPADIVTVEGGDYPVDCAEVTERWPEVKASDKAPLGDTAEDEHLRRLLDLQHTLQEDHAEFDQQAKAVLQ